LLIVKIKTRQQAIKVTGYQDSNSPPTILKNLDMSYNVSNEHC